MPRHFAVLLAKYQLIIVVGVLLLVWIVWQIKELVLLLFLSYVLTAALLPLTRWLEKRHISKVFGILGILLITLAILFFLMATFVPVVITQTQRLVARLPLYIAQLGLWVNIRVDTRTIQSFFTSRIDTISSNVISVITNTFTVFFTLSTFLIITFYLLMDHEKIQAAFLRLLPKSMRIAFHKTLEDVNKTLGSWVWGQIILSGFVGLLSGLVYIIAGVPFALPLAVFAAIMEVIPTIGPVIAFIPAVLLGFTISPFTGLLVAGGYVVVQILEGNILVPKIMQHSVGLHPLAVVLAVLLGAKFFGILGTLLSVPILAVMTVIYNRFTQK